MELKTIKELKEISWVKDTRDGKIKPLFSATRNYVRIGESKMLTSLFDKKFRLFYDEVSEEEMNEVMTERMSDFLESHGGEIRGLYEDSYKYNGGWNGTMCAYGDVVDRYPAESKLIDMDYLPDGVFEKLIQEFV